MTTSNTRTETDSMGTIEVTADRYWGTQTLRLLYVSSTRDREELFITY